jgi:hypothetical protein
MSVDILYFNALGFAVIVVCSKVKEAPEVPFVNDNMKDLPCRFRFRLVLRTLSS